MIANVARQRSASTDRRMAGTAQRIQRISKEGVAHRCVPFTVTKDSRCFDPFTDIARWP
jgi:hypothetical protein